MASCKRGPVPVSVSKVFKGSVCEGESVSRSVLSVSRCDEGQQSWRDQSLETNLRSIGTIGESV